ncbi:hypothetical protein ONZ45_g8521 [Pleurotus djamor]|nr:hypothetical protein ONZ45_g8521 [Pleurotus djamor]
MANTPRSRTPSRANTPVLGRSVSSRIIVPTLRHSSSKATITPSVSTDSSPPLPGHVPNHILDSAASSVLDLDMNEGILLQDADADVDAAEGDEVHVMGSLDTTAGSEDSKQSLREQLRKTLNHKQPIQDLPSPRPKMDTISHATSHRYTPREYYVLTDAGKPVFVSRPDDSNNDEGDKLRCINTPTSRITFLIRSPLYYVCYSDWGEPESVTRSHLEYLHLQIISIVTASHLRRLFERRGNFDLRRLLDGAESFLTSILSRLEFDLAISTSSLLCLKLDQPLRKRAADCLIPTSKMKDVLYVFLVANGRVVTLLRPKKHSIHPADIHILLNTIYNPSIIHSPATTSCVPICLPKFNPSGFMNAYISFLRKPEDSESKETTSGDDPEAPFAASDPTTIPAVGEAQDTPVPFPTDEVKDKKDEITVALVCINGAGEFDAIQSWCESVSQVWLSPVAKKPPADPFAQKLEKDGILKGIVSAIEAGKTDYTVGELSIPGLRHFIYKSRGQVQVTSPVFEEPYNNAMDQRRLITLYQVLHDAIHAKSGQREMLKLQYIKTEKESVLGWITQPFELYISLSPMLPKSAAIGAANSVVRWVKKEESRLFLRDAPVF